MPLFGPPPNSPVDPSLSVSVERFSERPLEDPSLPLLLSDLELEMAGQRCRHWCFTLNNYTDEEVERLSTLETEHPDFLYLVYGKETGENETPHLQGHISFKKAIRFAQVKALISQRCHLEGARDVPKSIDYCKKDGDFTEFGTAPTSNSGARSDLDDFKSDVKDGVLDLATIRETHSLIYAKYPRFVVEYLNDHWPKKVHPTHPLRPWQQDLWEVLEEDPNDSRTIHFVVDQVGNQGKTWFCYHYQSNHENTQILVPGPKKDMAFILDRAAKVIFLDAPRSKQGEYLQYDFLEELKNGSVFSSKYESQMKHLQEIHLVVMMNEMPDLTKLSQDRYNLIVLD